LKADRYFPPKTQPRRQRRHEKEKDRLPLLEPADDNVDCPDGVPFPDILENYGTSFAPPLTIRAD
jgi:hypothetical protein